MKIKTLVAVVSALLMALAGCGTKSAFVMRPIDTPVTIDVASINPQIQNEKIRKIIVEVCMRRGWKIDQSTNSMIQASLNHNGKEMATVEISYSKEKIEIRYKNSINLHYDGTKIHRSYNRWVKTLQVDISSGIAAA